MTETDEEYRLRHLCQDILMFFENITNDFDDFCDCELEDGNHQALCRTSLIRLDVEGFRSNEVKNEKKNCSIRNHKRNFTERI